MSTPMSFLAELKRRKVVRVAAVYGATAFVVAQVAELMFPRLGLPDWTITLIVWLAVLGLPIALVLGWAFELTPDGVRRSTPARQGSAAHAWLGARTLIVAGLLLVFGIGLGAGWFLRPASIQAGDGPVTIAVLPFDNLAGDESTEPFVLGVHDDLLTQLSRIEALRVISRTSVLEYRGSPKNVREIAAELGVAVVVEGGVQRSASRVRLNVQLIDAATDAHIWADTYERELTAENVFAIQGEIARSITGALRAELAPAEVAELGKAPTSSLAALEAYHTARSAFLDGGTRRDDIAPAMFERARSLAPDRMETRLAEAIYHYYARADVPRALQSFEALLRDAPGDFGILQGLASMEYAVPFFAWGTGDPDVDDPPRMFGRDMKRVDEHGEWQFHVWLWKHNPAGIFEDWNPAVSCDHA